MAETKQLGNLINEDMVQKMAGAGYISIQYPKSSNQQVPP